MEFYRFFPEKYRDKTLELDPYQDGCYRRLIDEYMTKRVPLPDSDASLARICGISLKDWTDHACGMLRAFFKHKNGVLFNKTCDEELAFQDSRAKFHSAKAKKAAEVRWSKNNDLDATSMPQAMHIEHARDKSKDISNTNVLDNTPIPPKQNPEGNGHAKQSRRRPANFIPEDFGPDLGCITLAGELGLNAERECREFIDYWRGRGEARADWQATFRNRLRKVAQYRAEREQRQANGRPGTRDVTGAALRVAARMQEKA